MKPVQLRLVILRPRRLQEQQDRLGGGEFQTHRAPEVKPFGPRLFIHQPFLTLLARSPKKLSEKRCYMSACGLGIGGADGEEGREEAGAEVDQPWQRAKVPSLRSEVLWQFQGLRLWKSRNLLI